MNTTEPEPLEERYASLLAAGEEALAAGHTLSVADSGDFSPELRLDLKRDLACVELLRQVLPFRGPTGPAAPVIGNAAPQLPWTSLGRFQIRRELGRGTFGIVYLAHDPRLNREVALKVPRVNALADPQLRERFQREARSAAALDHPNLVPVYEADEVGPVCFIASAYCPGITLAKWLKERDKPIPFRTAAALVARVAEGVDHAHCHGVVHRDLKPGNILLVSSGVVSPGVVEQTLSHSPVTTHHSPPTTDNGPRTTDELPFIPRVTDFGLAKFFLADEDASQTGSGALVGTPSYMAPEQAEGRRKEVGPAVDVYALGVILYELLTGRPPFQAESVLETLLLVRKEEPLRPARLRPRLPRDLETICLKCLEKEPHKRYVSAADLAADLRRFLAGEPIRARPISLLGRAMKWARRRPAVAALLGLIFVISATGFAGITWQWLRAEKSADDLDINLYFKNVALAEREWSVNNMLRADQLLEACPPHRRGWEWHYVMHLRHGNPTPFRGHTGAVRSVAWSPDGTRIATASADKTVKIWDAKTGHWLHTLREHTDLVCTVAFIDDRRLASASLDQTFKVWDVTTGKKLLNQKAADKIWRLAVSPDGQHLVTLSAGNDYFDPKPGVLQVWDVTTGEELHRLPTPPNANGLAISPDGRRFAVASGNLTSGENGAVTVYDATTGEELLTLPHPAGAGYGVAFSPDGHFLASSVSTFRADEGEVKIWDARSYRPLHTLRGHSGGIHSVAFSPDSRRLASFGHDKKVKIWDVTSGLEALTLHGHTSDGWCVSFSLDGYRLASSCSDQTIRVWDATPLERVGQGAARATLVGHSGRVNSVAFSPDRRRLATAGSDGSVRVWDAKSCTELHTLSGHKGVVLSVAFSPDSQLLASASEDGTVRVWEVASGRELCIFDKHKLPVECVAFGPYGRLASVSWDRTVRVWDPRTGREFFSISKASDWRVLWVAFSPNGRYLATGNADCMVKVWDAQTRQCILPLGPFRGRVLCVAFSPDSRRLAFCGTDQTATVYDLSARKPIVTFDKHTDQVNSVAVSPDCRRIASASNDATVKVWEADSGKEIATLRGHTRWVNSVAFSPDAKRLASASSDGKVMVWDAPPSDAKPVSGEW